MPGEKNSPVSTDLGVSWVLMVISPSFSLSDSSKEISFDQVDESFCFLSGDVGRSRCAAAAKGRVRLNVK